MMFVIFIADIASCYISYLYAVIQAYKFIQRWWATVCTVTVAFIWVRSSFTET